MTGPLSGSAVAGTAIATAIGAPARLANHLAPQGLEFGDRVGVPSPNHHLAHFPLYFTTPEQGFVPAAFEPRRPVGELRQQAGIVRPTLVVCDTRCNPPVRNLSSAGA